MEKKPSRDALGTVRPKRVSTTLANLSAIVQTLIILILLLEANALTNDAEQLSHAIFLAPTEAVGSNPCRCCSRGQD